MVFPTTSKETKLEFHKRIQDLETFLEDLMNAPTWAGDSFFRACSSMPLVAQMFKYTLADDEDQDSQKFEGFMTGVSSDVVLPLLRSIAKESALMYEESPNEETRQGKETTENLVRRFET